MKKPVKKKAKVTSEKKIKKPVKAKKILKKAAVGLSSADRNKIEKKLKEQLGIFSKALTRHERKTTALLPADAPEAVNVKQEIDVVEKQENYEAQTIRSVQAALRRLRAGTYGRCLTCRKLISAARLSAQPWSVCCVACQTAKERNPE